MAKAELAEPDVANTRFARNLDGRPLKASREVIDIPCSMLTRDLGAIPCSTWIRKGSAFVVELPRGSVAVLDGPEAERALATLRAAGPKVLQLYALLLDAWRGNGSSQVGSSQSASLTWKGVGRAVVANGTPDGRPSRSAREIQSAERIIRAMALLDFVRGPSSRRLFEPAPGPPILIDVADGLARIRPADAWVRVMSYPTRQIAKLPRSFVSLHARNDRYAIVLGWYLSIMVRVNRKYGFSYHVKLGTLLDGLGIRMPRRNPSRFLTAVIRGLERTPGFVFMGPSQLASSSRKVLLYSSPEILSSTFVFRPDQQLFSSLTAPSSR